MLDPFSGHFFSRYQETGILGNYRYRIRRDLVKQMFCLLVKFFNYRTKGVKNRKRAVVLLRVITFNDETAGA